MSDDLVSRLREPLSQLPGDDDALMERVVSDRDEAATALEEARAEIEAANYAHARMRDRAHAAESELSTLRARVREVVRPFAKIRQALELISANKPGDELLDDRAIFQTWGLKDTPTSKQITLGHLRAARQLMEDLT